MSPGPAGSGLGSIILAHTCHPKVNAAALTPSLEEKLDSLPTNEGTKAQRREMVYRRSQSVGGQGESRSCVFQLQAVWPKGFGIRENCVPILPEDPGETCSASLGFQLLQH